MNGWLNTIYRYNHNGDSWIMLEAKLKHPAQNVAAIIIDEDIFPLCSITPTSSTVAESTLDMDGSTSQSTAESSTDVSSRTDSTTEEALSTIYTDITTTDPSTTMEDGDISGSSTINVASTISPTTDGLSTTDFPDPETGSILDLCTLS